jgi:hypothetical protein
VKFDQVIVCQLFIPNLHLIGKAKTEAPFITLIFKKKKIGDKLMPFMGDC